MNTQQRPFFQAATVQSGSGSGYDGISSLRLHFRLWIAVTLALLFVSSLGASEFITNVTETFPHMTVAASPPKGQEFSLVFYSTSVPAPNPTEKWITTSIVERVTFTNFWNGDAVLSTKERPITNWTTHFVLVPPPPPAWIASTNNRPLPMFWPFGGGFAQ